MTRRTLGYLANNHLAIIAIFLALGGTAVAATKIGTKQLKNNAVTAKKIKNGAISEKKLAANAVNAGKIADGSVSSKKTTMRWALVDGDGTILNQSGGISAANPSTGSYYLDFGSSQQDRSIQVTPAYRDDDSGYETSAVATVCGGPPLGAICNDPYNTVNHVFVGTDNSTSSDNQAFYITTF